MSNVRRLGQGLWLVKNVNFTSGRRPCCQKRHLLKLANYNINWINCVISWMPLYVQALKSEYHNSDPLGA